MTVDPADLLRYRDLLARAAQIRAQSGFFRLFPGETTERADGVTHARALYPRHMEFFAAGAHYRERGFLAGNRVGKTVAGAYEVSCHLTGLYPDWWEGRRFPRPVRAWVSGKTGQTTRDIVQTTLLGEIEGSQTTKRPAGTGLIPGDRLGEWTWKPGTPNLVDTIRIRHVSGGWSTLGFKQYEQGRGSFEGTAQDIIWFDEEPDISVYGEAVIRTATTNGIVLLTFTPLEGWSETVEQFMAKIEEAGEPPEPRFHEGHVSSSRYRVQAGWDHVPHLSERTKAELLQSTMPHLREARSQGIPSLGSGAIYPVDEAFVRCAPFAIPEWWPRGYGLDVGWNCTAAVWVAQDPETKVFYVYAEYARGQVVPEIHAAAIRARGDWVQGAIDPASRGRGQRDGEQIIADYERAGLHLQPAINAVESGLYEVWSLLETGRLKVFNTLEGWFEEFRVYRRDEKGKIVKARDHRMDATRYAIVTFPAIAKRRPSPDGIDHSFRPADSISGY